jgi:hypothetical protein
MLSSVKKKIIVVISCSNGLAFSSPLHLARHTRPSARHICRGCAARNPPHASSCCRAAFRSRAIPRPPALPCVVLLASPLPCSRCRWGRLHHVQDAAGLFNCARGNRWRRDYTHFPDASRNARSRGRASSTGDARLWCRIKAQLFRALRAVCRLEKFKHAKKSRKIQTCKKVKLAFLLDSLLEPMHCR